MKALIIKRGNNRGRYYQGITIKEIIRKFMKSNPNLMLIKQENYKSHYELLTIDTKTNRWELYLIPKNKMKL